MSLLRGTPIVPGQLPNRDGAQPSRRGPRELTRVWSRGLASVPIPTGRNVPCCFTFHAVLTPEH